MYLNLLIVVISTDLWQNKQQLCPINAKECSHTKRARNVPTSDLGASRWCRSAHHKISIFFKAVALRALGWLLYSNLWLLLPGVDPVCLSWVFRQKQGCLGNCLFSASSLRRDSPCALHSKGGTSTLGNKLLVTSYWCNPCGWSCSDVVLWTLSLRRGGL